MTNPLPHKCENYSEPDQPNPLPHKCENYSEPDQLRGDLYSKNNVTKCKQLLILCINLQIVVPSSSGIAFFSFSFLK